MRGLLDLIRDCGFYPYQCLEPIPKRIILSRIEKAEWLLACSNPFVPFRPNCYDFWRDAWPREQRSSSESEALQLPSVSHKLEPKASASGPGKWVLKNIDHDAVWNVLAVAANRSGTIANEGSVILSDGKDFANTTRTLIHEWARLSGGERSYEAGSAIYRYGELKKTVQKYLEADDHWALNAQSWHWVPATPDVIFERRQ
jgi:hypothetical protein